MAALLAAGEGGWGSFGTVVIFLVIIGFQIISAIVKASKEASEKAGRQGRDTKGGDLWQPISSTVKRSAPPPVPPVTQEKKKRGRSQAGPPPVPHATIPEGVSKEASRSIEQMEAVGDRFKQRQNQAYEQESSDVPESSDEAFSLNRRSRKSRNKYVKINLRGKHLRNAVIAREILAPPRCFDI